MFLFNKLGKVSMKDNSDIPSYRDRAFIENDGRPDLRICGYCTQGRHSECRDTSCNCNKNNHRIV
jgi:hypothetical protein